MTQTYNQIVKFGLASNGFYGLVYSNDNGKTLHLLVGSDGRIFSQKDGDRIWPFLIGKVRSVMSLNWDDIQGKPTLVTKDELDQRLAKLNIPTTMSWDQITSKPDLALKQDIPKVTEFVKESELVDYAKKSELPSTDGLAKQTDLSTVKATAESALSNAEKAQSTADANQTTLTSKANQADLDQVKAKVAKAQQTADQAVKLANSAMAVIDTSSVNTNKQPSDYADGFSYELKSLNVLGIDRSQSHSSAKAGDLGLLTTKAVSYNGSKFVRQTLEQLDNARPLNYTRNSMNNNWSAWEASTNW
ncbi:hypothetical protein [Limosilactobacillus caecicola]|uniref:hypothetical protein n=1 Tax=Limosilactobacillus caecicola TaxID=2941332 RepID=UPI0020403DEB|nr:hypothetical protein [Limosilactobacillus caecicola]